MEINNRETHCGRFNRPRSAFQYTYRRNHPMGISQLEELQRKDPLHVALILKSDRSGFQMLISQNNLAKNTLEIIVKVISVACSSQRKENLSELLKMVSSVQSFMDQLRIFLGDVKTSNASFIEHLLSFLEALFFAHPMTSKSYVQSFLHLITSALDPRIDNYNNLTERADRLSVMISGNSQFVGNQIKLKSFRDISIYPVEEDLYPDPHLKPNLLKGKYNNVENYLDVQFRLFREDHVRPLREGIMSYRRQRSEGITSHFKDVRVYRNVRLGETLLTVDDGIVHKVRFYYDEKINWETSKRLIYGSLICLSVNGFKSFLVATVAASKPTELKSGVVFVRFVEEHVNEAHRLKDRTFVAIETDAYFEAYRHVLTALQEFNTDRFPMKEYIVDVSNQSKRPNYLCGNKLYCFQGIFCTTLKDLIYEMKNLLNRKVDTEDDSQVINCQCQSQGFRKTFSVLELDTWPDEEQFSLDKTQINAFKSALTQKLSLIQGPPGTGKTHVGLKIVQALLHNQHYQYNTTESVLKNPILVVCYTNHALDQFLEGVLKLTDKVVRVGGRSESQALAKHNLKYLKRHSYNDFTRSFRGAVRRSIETSIDKIESLQQLRDQANVRLLTDTELQNYIPEHHWKSLVNDHPVCLALSHNCAGSFISYWLASQIPPHYYYEMDGQVYLWFDDTFEEIEHLLEDMCYSEFLYNNIVCPEDAASRKRSFLGASANRLKPEIFSNYNRTCNPSVAELSEVADLDFIRAQRMEDDDVLEGAKVIYRHSEQTEKPSNKSQETFVAKQLKCQPMNEIESNLCWNVWKLRLPDRWRLYKSWIVTLKAASEVNIGNVKEEYGKDLKLYDELRQERERLVTQGYDVIGMTTTGAAKYKHLMRGLKPRVVIVEEAAEVQEAHVVSSLSENTEHLILIGDHQQLRPNPACYELAKNYGLDISLFERLVNNGLPYCRLGIQHRMRPCISQLLVPHIYSSLEDHYSVSLYEEVRGMEKNMFFLNHGFLETQLNTSKCNEFEAEFLVTLCKHFVLQGYEPEQITILSTYLAQYALIKSKASNIPQIRGTRITVVDNYQGEENDIVLVSFVRSNERGSIGFLKTDNRVCVSLSRAKSGFYCIGNFDLLRKESSLWKGIVNKLREEKAIGSSLVTKCHIHGTLFAVSKASDFEEIPGGGCRLPCDALLKCGHICMKRCHPRDTNHEEYQCTLPCTKVNPSCAFGHKCTRPCWAECGTCEFKVLKIIEPCLHRERLPCSTDPDSVICQKPCQKLFSCGHRCQSKCGEPCSECTTPVCKTAPCGHDVYVPCTMSNDVSVVVSACKKPCCKTLVCGHDCTSHCGSDCTEYCVVNLEKLLPCGHLCKIPCYKKKEDDVSLMKTCNSPCNSLLKCGHQCKGTCGECVQGRLHVPCKQICEKELLCGHVIKNVLCFKSVPSCKARCRNSCSHRQCFLPCSCVCNPCKSPCTWNCEHHQCSRICDEPCDRPVCNLPCTKLLPCGHNCLGYCGEPCPPRCLICHKENLVDMTLYEDEVQLESRLIVLENCKHVFHCQRLEIWLKERHESATEAFRKIYIPKCPLCQATIRRSGRLGVLVHECKINIGIVKRLLFGSKLNNEKKKDNLSKRIISLGLSKERSYESEELLAKLNGLITKKKQPHHMLMYIDSYTNVLEELSLIKSTLVKCTGSKNSVMKTLCETSNFIVKRILSTLGDLDQQLCHDVNEEIKILWSRMLSNLTNGISVYGGAGKLKCSTKEYRRFSFGICSDFLVGNWYLCSKDHVSCFTLHANEDFMCIECELLQSCHF